LQSATDAYPAPRGFGRLKYGTQVASGPPAFVLFGMTFPGASYQRYLENSLRRAFAFDGVPVRISFRRPDGRRSGSRGARSRGEGA
jgi:GTP-binding protein